MTDPTPAVPPIAATHPEAAAVLDLNDPSSVDRLFSGPDALYPNPPEDPANVPLPGLDVVDVDAPRPSRFAALTLWLSSAMPTPTKPADALALLFTAQAAYEMAQRDALRAGDAFYRHDAKGATVEANAVDALMRGGMAATPAAKAAKVDPDVMLWQNERGRLAFDKANAERWLGVARRRHTALLATCALFGAVPALGGELARLTNDGVAPLAGDGA